MKSQVIGREEETRRINEYIESNRSEFIAVYGRRRVGKTFLVRNIIAGKASFAMSGMDNVTLREQLTNFDIALHQHGFDTTGSTSWIDAFNKLEQYLDGLKQTVKIVFIDEMPWMDTPKSHFIQALEHFWNNWASARSDIKLIVCGSATNWMLSNIINNRGGLHNRVTHQILLKPFTLRECKSYFGAYGFPYCEREIIECHMVMGGVPYYLSLMDKKLSVAQNIDHLMFAEGGELRNEAGNLFRSLFRKSADYEDIIKCISSKRKGLTRSEIIEATGLNNNMRLTRMLEELEQCGFIRSYDDLGGKSRQATFQLVDPFVHFAYSVMTKNRNKDEHFWSNTIMSPLYNSWSGLAFEMVCLNHIAEIKQALGISGMQCGIYSWRSKPGEMPGAQVDMVIDRADRTINLCEIKFAQGEYVVTSKYEGELLNKVSAMQSSVGKGKTIRLTMITSNGLHHNSHSSIVLAEVCMKNLLGQGSGT